MIWNIGKQKQPIRTTRRKNNPKNPRIVSATCGTTKSIPTFTLQGCQKKRKSKKLEINLKKIMKENFPNLRKEIDMQV